MATPTTVDDFLNCVRQSSLLDPQRLEAYIERLRAAVGDRADFKVVAQLLVRDGYLTKFQAEQLVLGRWRNFTIGGKYKVLERLGYGGMASVFLCEHQVMKRLVAVKVLNPKQARDATVLEAFHREARLVARLHHPNVVEAYDVDYVEGSHFLVTEFVEGRNLEDIVRARGPLDPFRVAHYLVQAAAGLSNFQEASLVHRDIKPANLLVDLRGIVKILDLGLALLIKDDPDAAKRSGARYLLGSIDYIAPEQIRDSESVDIRADIYSLGATAYYLLTGASVCPEGTLQDKLAWHKTQAHAPLEVYRDDLPPELVDAIDKMLSKDPADRFQTPAEVIDALAPVTATPISPPPEDELLPLSPAVHRHGQPIFRTLLAPVSSGGSASWPTYQ